MITDQQIIDAIKADPTAKTLADQGADNAVAARITITQSMEYRLTATGLNNHLGVIRGATILEELRTASAANVVYKEIVRMLENDRPGDGGIDLNHPDATTLMATLVADLFISLTQEEADTLLALAQESVSPPTSQVSKALLPFRPEGKVKVLELP